MRHLPPLCVCASFILAAASVTAQTKDWGPEEAAAPENPLKNAYFGELHVHTSYSLDAFIGGNRQTPDMAYKFAKGETITVNGAPHSIVKPLDFAAVTDHAEYIGEMFSAQVEGAPGYDHPDLVTVRGLSDYKDQERWFLETVVANARSDDGGGHPPFYAGPETTISAWSMMVDTAESHYAPGSFTTFAAFEWTSAPGGGNMHRNVIFRDMNVPELPFTSFDSNDEEKLWNWMEAQEQSGSTLLAIPHNSNASKGLMFEPIDNSGDPIDAEYAERRSWYEPLIEIMQIKGNSEVHQGFWQADEFANFENADSAQNRNERWFKKDYFVRHALIAGTGYQTSLGANPYKLGIVGGTDSHNGTPSDVVEDNYIGSHGGADATPERRRTGEIPGWLDGPEASPGAITGVWAAKNTRGALFDAMQARETFATSGTRIKPRFFGGIGLDTNSDPAKMVADGYANGVPMGSTLGASDTTPSFTVSALKDPDGANLDRIQIIKGWVDDNGDQHEQIINVVWSGERSVDANGKLAPVGNTVDPGTAQYTNDIGASELIGHWTDDSFDPERPAVYYARIIEIPTPRWTTYDSVKNGLPLLEDIPVSIQERAWTSPIWYTP